MCDGFCRHAEGLVPMPCHSSFSVQANGMLKLFEGARLFVGPRVGIRE